MAGSTLSNAVGRWFLDSAQNGLSSLHFDDSATVSEANLGPNDVLVAMHAASLNYRDLVITQGRAGVIPMPCIPSLIPGSDGAGTVLAVGSGVSGLMPGDKVITYMLAQVSDDQMLRFEDTFPGLGQNAHGTLCRKGIFHYNTLIAMPDGFSFEEAATLSCSGLTAWNALFGIKGREVRKGDWVLIQGTGGVSIAALQIAVAAGAHVIATTSSDIKAIRLRELGAEHVFNYRHQQNWGAEAKKLSPYGRGVDHIVDIGGTRNLHQSLAAVRIDGVVTLVGGAGDGPDGAIPAVPDLLSALYTVCIVRGIVLGTRSMLREMASWLIEHGVHPALDDVVFELEEAKAAYERLQHGKHFSKIVVKIV